MVFHSLRILIFREGAVLPRRSILFEKILSRTNDWFRSIYWLRVFAVCGCGPRDPTENLKLQARRTIYFWYTSPLTHDTIDRLITSFESITGFEWIHSCWFSKTKTTSPTAKVAISSYKTFGVPIEKLETSTHIFDLSLKPFIGSCCRARRFLFVSHHHPLDL